MAAVIESGVIVDVVLTLEQKVKAIMLNDKSDSHRVIAEATESYEVDKTQIGSVIKILYIHSETDLFECLSLFRIWRKFIQFNQF